MAEPQPASPPRSADVEGPVVNASEEKEAHTSTAEAPPEPNGVDKSPRSQQNDSLPATMQPRRSPRPEPDVKTEEHVPAASDRPLDEPEAGTQDSSPTKSRPSQLQEHAEDANNEPPTSGQSPDAQTAPATANNATPTPRKQTNGTTTTIGSTYSGNKIRHLKKDDGVPLWRKDIQFKFLTLVFDDKTPVFTRASDGQTGLPFADVYIDAMAKSSKTSRVLKEKLRLDRTVAINMAKVCLLVNFGRMNTTLNFFPEMRAQLRTYHAIPALQAHTDDTSAYKQLQDAPRLKSILKGASEDTNQPATIEKLKKLPAPRTNPVNLVFVLSQYAPKVSELHFFPPRDFFDLVLGSTLSSESRAKAFLWLMWYYMESDFSKEAALENPFGPGLVGKGTGGLPLKVPELQVLTEQEADAENIDTPDEIQYGEEKQQERKRILVDDDVLGRYPKRQKKGLQDYASDDQVSEDMPGGILTPTASRERPSLGGRRPSEDQVNTMWAPVNQATKRAVAEDDDDEQNPSQVRRPRAKRAKRESSKNRASTGQPQQRIVLKTKMDQTPDTVSPAPPGAAHPILNQFDTGSPGPSYGIGSRRSRPMTQHQLALEQNRKQRVDYALAQHRQRSMKDYRTKRHNEPPFVRAERLMRALSDGYDTDDENSWGKGGICPNPQTEEDYGESATSFLSAIRRTARRLQRWDWNAIATGETQSWVNEIGRGNKVEAWTGLEEAATAPEAGSAATKPKGRGGRRKAVSTGGEGEKLATGRRGGRASGRKRGSGEGRKARVSGRASKASAAKAAVKEEPETHNHSPAPEPRPYSSPAPQADEGEEAAPENGEDGVDKEHLLEVEGDEDEQADLPENSPRGSVNPEAVEEEPSSPGVLQVPVEHDGEEDDGDEEGEDDGSSVHHDNNIPQTDEPENATDSDDHTDDEMASSAVGDNGYGGDETSIMDMDTAAGTGGDESMVET